MNRSNMFSGLILVLVVAGVAAVAWMKERSPSASPTADAASQSVPSDSQTSTGKGAPEPEGSLTPAAKAGLPRMVDFGGEKCQTCIEMAPILAEVRREFAGRAVIEFVDIIKDPAAGHPYNIRVMPTQVFLDRDGKEVWRHEGGLKKPEIVAKLKELGA